MRFPKIKVAGLVMVLLFVLLPIAATGEESGKAVFTLSGSDLLTTKSGKKFDDSVKEIITGAALQLVVSKEDEAAVSDWISMESNQNVLTEALSESINRKLWHNLRLTVENVIATHVISLCDSDFIPTQVSVHMSANAIFVEGGGTLYFDVNELCDAAKKRGGGVSEP